MRLCDTCLQAREYCERQDAYFCPDCDVWVEGPCGDPACEYCTTRPERPSGCEHPEPHVVHD